MAPILKLINDNDALQRLYGCPLFKDMTEEEIFKCMECCGAEVETYAKDEMIFTEADVPTRMPVLVSGSVRCGRDSIDGKRSIIVNYDKPGDIFGDVILFLQKKHYGYFAQAAEPTKVVYIPHYYVTNNCERNCGHHMQLVTNLLLILANSAYSLANRLEILMCQTLRQKIAKMILLNCEGDFSKKLVMTREEMAQLLNVARPSLSRELMKMVDDNLIKVEGRKISVADVAALEDLF